MGAGRTYGHIEGQPVGTHYPNRKAMVEASIHRPPQAGIWGGTDGAESVVVSGGYRDDVDLGDEIVYTGQGGNDPATGRQVADQVLERGNLGLAVSAMEGYPVRVIRGSGGDPTHSPASGFRYDGLFRVADYWHEVGLDGFRIWRYRLELVDGQTGPASSLLAGSGDGAAPAGSATPGKSSTMVQRVIRSSKVAEWVKSVHGYACQVCGKTLDTPAGLYAEAAHIRALGRPHNGPDVTANVLCLCPNHHVLFDAGGFTIDPDLSIVIADGRADGSLRTHPKHDVDAEQLDYHRRIHRA